MPLAPGILINAKGSAKRAWAATPTPLKGPAKHRACGETIATGEFVARTPPQKFRSYLVVEALRHGLPIMDRRWHGRFLPEATLVGPEARGSAPVRIIRDDVSRESPGVEGLYPVGEGAGYAGGIVSAAVDGLRSAKSIVGKYAPLDLRIAK